jgi:hypothetical protein
VLLLPSTATPAQQTFWQAPPVSFLKDPFFSLFAEHFK